MTAYLMGRSARKGAKGSGGGGTFVGAKYIAYSNTPTYNPATGPFVFGSTGYSLDTIAWDEGGFTNGAAGFLIPISGLYRVELQVLGDAAGAAAYLIAWDAVNFDTFVTAEDTLPGAGGGSTQTVYLRAGTTYKITNTTNTTYAGASLAIEYVGPKPASSPLV